MTINSERATLISCAVLVLISVSLYAFDWPRGWASPDYFIPLQAAILCPVTFFAADRTKRGMLVLSLAGALGTLEVFRRFAVAGVVSATNFYPAWNALKVLALMQVIFAATFIYLSFRYVRFGRRPNQG